MAEQDTEEQPLQETVQNVKEMWNTLKRLESGSSPVLEVVMNHQDFAQTVENMFALSFMVRHSHYACCMQ